MCLFQNIHKKLQPFERSEIILVAEKKKSQEPQLITLKAGYFLQFFFFELFMKIYYGRHKNFRFKL
jgi:hypothetical protein